MVAFHPMTTLASGDVSILYIVVLVVGFSLYLAYGISHFDLESALDHHEHGVDRRHRHDFAHCPRLPQHSNDYPRRATSRGGLTVPHPLTGDREHRAAHAASSSVNLIAGRFERRC
jgi:hypothetical protein